MNVTRDVILDVLPLYLASEASLATRTLVDEYLAGDADLAQYVRGEQMREATTRPTPGPDADLELRALGRAKHLLAVQRWLFGLAWFFTASTLTSETRITNNGVQSFQLLIFKFPLLFGSTLLAAIACWAGYFVLRRRARAVV